MFPPFSEKPRWPQQRCGRTNKKSAEFHFVDSTEPVLHAQRKTSRPYGDTGCTLSLKQFKTYQPLLFTGEKKKRDQVFFRTVLHKNPSSGKKTRVGLRGPTPWPFNRNQTQTQSHEIDTPGSS